MKKNLEKRNLCLLIASFLMLCIFYTDAGALTVHVKDRDGNDVTGFRWMVEEDTTFHVIPGLQLTDTLGTLIHNSYAPVVSNGKSDLASAVVNIPSDKRYLITVIPYAGYSISGKNVAVGQTDVTVIVNPQPLPTAQITVLVFHDISPINNAPDLNEAGLANFKVVISDPAGQQMLDAFGNMLGTTYQRNPDGTFILDADGAPVVDVMGSGILLTDANGELTIKYIAPGKYGVVVVPPAGETGWIQTSTIEGTPTVDAWVKANEPPKFVEFGPASYHVFYGFIKQFNNIPTPAGPSGTITGKVVFNHFDRPPNLQGFWPGEPVDGAWVGLNTLPGRVGLYAAPCNGNSEFTISNVPPGTYQLVTWDENLDAIFGFNQVVVPAGGGTVNLGNILSFRWFGKLEGSVFLDNGAGNPAKANNGFRDTGEVGIAQQAVNLRFRNGTVYQSTLSDHMGNYALEEVFPFFKWLVVEIDFARYKATGLTSVVDWGGVIPAADGWNMPSFDKLNPQPQTEINPNTGNNLSRTVVGEVLTQAMHLFLGQTNIIDWGKTGYGAGQNGGISGIVYYAVTRAEDDPRYAAAEPWEPGIPRVQMNLYFDVNCDGVIDDLNGDGPTLADVDNYPFGWRDDPALFEPGVDVDRDGDGVFDAGDAIQIATTDSWDDNKPTGAIHDPLPVIHGNPVQPGFDNFGTWNQIRDGVFDGGYAFGSYFPGGIASGSEEVDGLPNKFYIVEATTPPGYELFKEEDKNVDFGDEWTPSTLLLPPVCVGDPHLVPPYMSFQTDDNGIPLPGIDPADLVPVSFAGQWRPRADRKQVQVATGKNTAADFYFFTQMPKGAMAIGFINNDLAAEFDPTSPIFGEKSAPSWVPISFQDWAGNEVARVYSDEFGTYNAMVPSSFTNSMPAPAGFSPQMLTFVINHPGPIPDPDNPDKMIIDPYYDPDYGQSPFTFNFQSGTMTYLDTPVFPIAAFVGYPNRRLDVEPAAGTPVIYSVEGPDGGPIICNAESIVTIKSVGTKLVPNPDYVPNDPGNPQLIGRDFGFGDSAGTVTVGGVSVPIDSWSNTEVKVVINPASVATGTVHVTRQDTGKKTELGVTLHINECQRQVIHVSGGALYPNTPIQDAVDAAADDALIIIEPGIYWENVIVYKPVTLQGSGAESTVINAMHVPSEKVTIWENKVAQLAAANLMPLGDFAATQAPGILIYANPGRFSPTQSAEIDSLQITGASAGGGIYAAGNADYSIIRNNKIRSNQGTLGGGITLGEGEQGVATNVGIQIRNNQILKNGGITGGGGITIHSDATSYRVIDNLIMGNFTQWSGAGIAHFGLSDDGWIIGNKIVFNEVFYGGQIGGDGGGIYVGSRVNPEDPGELDDGAGNVIIANNLIQGNLAGSGFGGGICAMMMNGQDVLGNAASWYQLRIFNNMIVNNVAANAAGGIFMQDVAAGYIINNTIANNESSGTAADTFTAGNLSASNPQPAGIVSVPHTQNLSDISGQIYSDPVLVNNIVWNNHSYYWDSALNNGAGGTALNNSDPVWDLAVIGLPVVQYLNPEYCLLTSYTDSTGADYDNGNNLVGNPLFVSGYTNTLVTAAVLDEGGNFITVRFNEIDLQGDYHITAGSPAIDLGIGAYMDVYPHLYQDYDKDWRPLGGVPVDSGADELRESVCVYDMNADCSIHIQDLVIFAGFWLDFCTMDVPCPGDFNGNGVVNLLDFSNFSMQFGRTDCCP
ncbi:MAG TPA: hypothetical protein PKB02_14895 [Anaerohalosphaeraceae bacterium]|nr:hypothetical protein [Anaerohalosphaeraceae bacterium]